MFVKRLEKLAESMVIKHLQCFREKAIDYQQLLIMSTYIIQISFTIKPDSATPPQQSNGTSQNTPSATGGVAVVAGAVATVAESWGGWAVTSLTKKVNYSDEIDLLLLYRFTPFVVICLFIRKARW